jgi:hypothetical protein
MPESSQGLSSKDCARTITENVAPRMPAERVNDFGTADVSI